MAAEMCGVCSHACLFPKSRKLIAEVLVPETRIFRKGNRSKINAIECGIRENMIRSLVQRGFEVHVVPWDYDFSKGSYDGLFVSD